MDPYANTLFAGFLAAPAPDAAAFLAPLVPPGNYKKPETIAAWMVEAQQDRGREISSLPVVGTLTEVVLVDLQGVAVLALAVDAQARVPGALSQYLKARAADPAAPLRVFGFDAPRLGRMAALAGLREAALAGEFVPRVGGDPPTRLSLADLGESTFQDPYAMALSAEGRRHVGVANLLDWFCVPYAGRDLATAAGCAAAALYLSVALGLVPKRIA